MQQFLVQITKMKENLYQKKLLKKYQLNYNKDFNEQDELKIAQQLLDNQAILLQHLHKEDILIPYYQYVKNITLSIIPIETDTKQWNQFKKNHSIYFEDLLNMVEDFIINNPNKKNESTNIFHLINEIFILKHQLFYFFTPLVLYYSKQQLKKSSQLGILDLQQEGFLGLIQAIETFYFVDLNQSLKSYFAYFIKHQIKKTTLENQDGIRVPYQAILKQLNNQKTEDNSLPKYFYQVSNENTEDSSLDSLDNESHHKITDSLWNKSLSQTLQNILLTLSEREREIIKLRYGFDQNTKPHTLDYIGQKLNITKERVRQIEKIALKKIQSKSKNILVKEDLLDES